MEVGMTFKLDDYLSHDDMRQLAEECFATAVRKAIPCSEDVERVLSNSAYATAAKIVEDKHHIDLEKVLTEKVAKILLDEDKLRYVVFEDMRPYGGTRVGKGLEILERIIVTKFQERFEKIAENIVNSIDMKSKKFQKLVVQEVAKIVAKRIQGGN